ncbi:unnamed protein product [Lactuca saligna]|uniref:Uncharacterized protein n=1 Tax=Lactuca saligna TaxID=75948 RepID=A0AA36EFR9_LACSI|nr:unnamed protein product [Lactuca saligna]
MHKLKTPHHQHRLLFFPNISSSTHAKELQSKSGILSFAAEGLKGHHNNADLVISRLHSHVLPNPKFQGDKSHRLLVYHIVGTLDCISVNKKTVIGCFLYGVMVDDVIYDSYMAVIKHSYGVILYEKKNVERALKHGIEKFPDSLSLKEWCEKNEKMFKEIKNAESGGMKDKDSSFDGHSNKGDGDGVKESKFSLTRGLVVDGEKKVDGGGFSTPQMDKVGNTDNLTCSQFLENHEVLATAIKMTDEAVLESFKKEKKRGNKVMETVEVWEEDDDHGKRGKKDQKIHVYGESPFLERIVRMSDKVKKVLDKHLRHHTWDARLTRFQGTPTTTREEIWNIGSGHVFHQGFSYHFKSNTFIHAIIIDCWSSLLNRMEELRDVGLVSRVLFNTNFLKRYWVDHCHLKELKNYLIRC